MILYTILANRLQAVLSSLIVSEQTFVVKGRTIQANLRLIRLIIGQVENEAPVINLDQFKGFSELTIVFWRLSFWPPVLSLTFKPGSDLCMHLSVRWWKSMWFDQTLSHCLAPFSKVIRFGFGAFLPQVKDEFGPTRNPPPPHWSYPLGYFLRLCWRCFSA